MRSVTKRKLDQKDCELNDEQRILLLKKPGQGITVLDQKNQKTPEVLLVSTQAMREYLEHLWKHYKKADKLLRGEILNELCRNFGVHRISATPLMTCKHVPRILHGFKGGRRKKYSDRAVEHLAVL